MYSNTTNNEIADLTSSIMTVTTMNNRNDKNDNNCVKIVDSCPLFEESIQVLNQWKEIEDKKLEQSEMMITVDEIKSVETIKKKAEQQGFIKYYIRCYYELWKTRLSSLVVFTTLGGYYAAGGDLYDWKSSFALASGTFMQAACANSLNEWYEVDRDRMMARTKSRPLPTNRISKLHALIQAAVMGVGGTYLLFKFNNPLTAGLGLANILIYAGIYTPTKVMHWCNTWIGTLNGSLACLMGSSSVTNNVNDISGLFLFSTMYFWQISHFMAIGYKCKFDYSRAGYKMLSISNPEQAATQAVIHSAVLFPLCWSLPYFGVVPWWFAVVSTPINYYLLLKPSIQFKRQVNYERATSLFFKTLGHLPALFITAVFAFCWQRSIKGWIKDKSQG